MGSLNNSISPHQGMGSTNKHINLKPMQIDNSNRSIGGGDNNFSLAGSQN